MYEIYKIWEMDFRQCSMPNEQRWIVLNKRQREKMKDRGQERYEQQLP